MICMVTAAIVMPASAVEIGWYRTDGISDGTLNDATAWDVPVETYFYFDVGNIGLQIVEVEIRFSALHTYTGDLGAVLKSPVGTTVELFRKLAVAYGADQANFEDTLFDDDAGAKIMPSDAPFSGTYQVNPFSGAAALGDFDGQNPQGKWTLIVSDYFPGDTGELLAPGDSVPWRGAGALGTRLFITVPEPASLTTLAAAAAFLALRRRRGPA